MKRRFISLALAAVLLASASGCAMTTPASVGSIGDVEIPAGVYLLLQYNAYTTASALADLAEGESTGDVKAVLRAQTTGDIGDEEVTATGQEYIARLTQREMEFYAAVQTTFAELGGELDAETLAAVSANVDSVWEANGELYAANGIGKDSLEAYLLSASKAQAILQMQYGPEGLTPVTEAEYEDFLENECYYVDSVSFPLMDYSTYTFADADTIQTIEDLAADCAEELAESEVPQEAAATREALDEVAVEYVPQAFEALGSSFDASQAPYYVSSQLYLPDTIATYDDAEGNNPLRDALDKADGDWTWANLSLSVMVGRQGDPLESAVLEDLIETYDLLTAIRGDGLEADLYAQGAALPHALDQRAMDTYKAANIRRTV